jgi:hypothetical protein
MRAAIFARLLRERLQLAGLHDKTSWLPETEREIGYFTRKMQTSMDNFDTSEGWRLKKHNKLINKAADARLQDFAENVLMPIPELNCPGKVSYYVPEKTYETIKKIKERLKGLTNERRMKSRKLREELSFYLLKQNTIGLTAAEKNKVQAIQDKIFRIENDVIWISNKQTRATPNKHNIEYMGTTEENKRIGAAYWRMPADWRKLIDQKYFFGSKNDTDIAERLETSSTWISREFNQIYTYIAGVIELDFSHC